MLTPEQRAREFVTVGFRDLGVPSLEPYITIVAELIDGAEREVIERCGQIADELAEAKRKDGSEQMSIGAALVAEAIRIFGRPLSAAE